MGISVLAERISWANVKPSFLGIITSSTQMSNLVFMKALKPASPSGQSSAS